MDTKTFAEQFEIYFNKYLIGRDNCIVTGIHTTKNKHNNDYNFYLNIKQENSNEILCTGPFSITEVMQEYERHTVAAIAEMINAKATAILKNIDSHTAHINNERHPEYDKRIASNANKLIESNITSIDIDFEGNRSNSAYITVDFDGFSYVLKTHNSLGTFNPVSIQYIDYLSKDDFTNMWAKALENTYKNTDIHIMVINEPGDDIYIYEDEEAARVEDDSRKVITENNSTYVFSITDTNHFSENFYLLLVEYYNHLAEEFGIDKFYILPTNEYEATIFGVYNNDQDTIKLMKSVADIEGYEAFVYDVKKESIILEKI